jgi:hypothetical protein
MAWLFFKSFIKEHYLCIASILEKIILLPKCAEAIKNQQHRHICLLNVSFKVFTKVITNRLSEVAHRVIQPTQFTFLPRRNIMEGVITLHETIHEFHRKNKAESFFKLILKRHMIRSNGCL